MSGFLSSKLRKIQETLGTAQVTEDTQEVRDVKEHLANLKAINQKVNKYAKALSAEYDKAGTTSEKLGSALVEYSGLYPRSPLGESLIRIGETQNAITALQKAFASQVTEILVNHTRGVLEDDLKRAAELKSKHEEARMQYDIMQGKRKELVPKEVDPKYQTKIEDCDQQLNVAKTNYTTFGDQLVTRLNDFDQKSSSEIIETLKAFTIAQEEFFRDGQTLLSQIIPYIDNIQQQNEQVVLQIKNEKEYLLTQKSNPSTPPITRIGTVYSVPNIPNPSPAASAPASGVFTQNHNNPYDDDLRPPSYTPSSFNPYPIQPSFSVSSNPASYEEPPLYPVFSSSATASSNNNQTDHNKNSSSNVSSNSNNYNESSTSGTVPFADSRPLPTVIPSSSTNYFV